MINKAEILQAHQERFATKEFDSSKSISNEDLNFILEIARLSPSSYGLEPWQFLVLKDANVREKLKPVAWGQPQITDASHLIVLLARNEDNLFKQGYLRTHYENRGIDSGFFAENIGKIPNLDEWTKRQTYIALGNIMSSAKMIGIDSCGIEGFSSPEAVAEVVGVDTSKFNVSAIVALGYRSAEPKREKQRLDFDEVIQFHKTA